MTKLDSESSRPTRRSSTGELRRSALVFLGDRAGAFRAGFAQVTGRMTWRSISGATRVGQESDARAEAPKNRPESGSSGPCSDASAAAAPAVTPGRTRSIRLLTPMWLCHETRQRGIARRCRAPELPAEIAITQLPKGRLLSPCRRQGTAPGIRYPDISPVERDAERSAA